MPDSPLISIAVTTYKRPDFLRIALQSILSQSFNNFEVIVGNNDPGTPINLLDLGINDSRIRLINRPANLGPLGNMLDLLQQANGQYFSWLADDDMYLSDSLFAKIHEATLQFDHPKILFTATQKLGESRPLTANEHSSSWQQLTPADFLHSLLQRKIEVIGNYGFWDLTLLKKLGGLKILGDGFSPYTDTLLGFEAAYAPSVFYLNSPMLFFRLHADSVSYSAQDLHAYTSAQMEMTGHLRSIMSTLKDYKTRELDFYSYLVEVCLRVFAGVAMRSGSAQYRVWPSYLVWLAKAGSELPWRLQIKLWANIGREIIKIGLRRAGLWLT